MMVQNDNRVLLTESLPRFKIKYDNFGFRIPASAVQSIVTSIMTLSLIILISAGPVRAVTSTNCELQSHIPHAPSSSQSSSGSLHLFRRRNLDPVQVIRIESLIHNSTITGTEETDIKSGISIQEDRQELSGSTFSEPLTLPNGIGHNTTELQQHSGVLDHCTPDSPRKCHDVVDSPREEYIYYQGEFLSAKYSYNSILDRVCVDSERMTGCHAASPEQTRKERADFLNQNINNDPCLTPLSLLDYDSSRPGPGPTTRRLQRAALLNFSDSSRLSNLQQQISDHHLSLRARPHRHGASDSHHGQQLSRYSNDRDGYQYQQTSSTRIESTEKSSSSSRDIQYRDHDHNFKFGTNSDDLLDACLQQHLYSEYSHDQHHDLNLDQKRRPSTSEDSSLASPRSTDSSKLAHPDSQSHGHDHESSLGYHSQKNKPKFVKLNQTWKKKRASSKTSYVDNLRNIVKEVDPTVGTNCNNYTQSAASSSISSSSNCKRQSSGANHGSCLGLSPTLSQVVKVNDAVPDQVDAASQEELLGEFTN